MDNLTAFIETISDFVTGNPVREPQTTPFAELMSGGLPVANGGSGVPPLEGGPMLPGGAFLPGGLPPPNGNLPPAHLGQSVLTFRALHALENHSTKWLDLALTPLIITLGIVGNNFSFLIMSHQSVRKKSFSIITRFLAVADTIVLIFELLMWVNLLTTVLYGAPFINPGTGHGCRLGELYKSVNFAATWLLVLLTVERFVKTTFPFWSRENASPIRTVLFCVLITLTSLAIYIWDVSRVHFDGVCKQDTTIIQYSIVMWQFLTYYVPVLLVMILNILMIRSLSKTLPSSANDAQSKKTSVILSTIIAFFVIFKLPMIIHFIIATYQGPGPTSITAMYVANVFNTANYACNFYIFLMGGMYRRLFMEQICRRARKVVMVRAPQNPAANPDQRQQPENSSGNATVGNRSNGDESGSTRETKPDSSRQTVSQSQRDTTSEK